MRALVCLVLLAGCASPASIQRLQADQAGCNAGDPQACLAANYQAEANDREAWDNGAAAGTVTGAILFLPLDILFGVATNDSRHSWQHVHERNAWRWPGEPHERGPSW